MNYAAAKRYISQILRNNGFSESYKSKTTSTYHERWVDSDRQKIRVSDHELGESYNPETGEMGTNHRQPDGIVLDRQADYTKDQINAKLTEIFEDYGWEFDLNAAKAPSLAGLRRQINELLDTVDILVSQSPSGEWGIWYWTKDYRKGGCRDISKNKDADLLRYIIADIQKHGVARGSFLEHHVLARQEAYRAANNKRWEEALIADHGKKAEYTDAEKKATSRRLFRGGMAMGL